MVGCCPKTSKRFRKFPIEIIDLIIREDSFKEPGANIYYWEKIAEEYREL